MLETILRKTFYECSIKADRFYLLIEVPVHKQYVLHELRALGCKGRIEIDVYRDVVQM